MSEIDPVEFGEVKAELQALRREFTAMSDKVDQLVDLAAKGKGGFWVGMMMISAISSAVGWVAHWFTVTPK